MQELIGESLHFLWNKYSHLEHVELFPVEMIPSNYSATQSECTQLYRVSYMENNFEYNTD